MSDDDRLDPAADTGRFQAFADGAEPPRQSPNAFRVATLLGGLVVFAGLVFLLLR